VRNSSVVMRRRQRQREERVRRRKDRQQCRRERACERRMSAMWSRSQGLVGAVIEDVSVAEDGSVVICARPRAGERERCGKCHRRCLYRDEGDGRRQWRGLDCGVVRVYIEADAPRVSCFEHGVIVAAVPWARHDTGFTRMFDDLVAWKVVEQSAKAVCEELGIAWRTVGRICKRVCAERRSMLDPFGDLREIGFDEISVRRGQRYMTVVVDHRSGRLIWAAAGRDQATVKRFLDLLGQEGCEKLELVSCDDADWVTVPVAERCPNADICLDAFHVVKAATDAVDEVRREVWNEARRAGDAGLARKLKGARYALWKNPDKLTGRQQQKLAFIKQLNSPIYTAYLLKEQLRQIYELPGRKALALLDAWLKWARRCQLEPFVKLAARITKQRYKIEGALIHGLSNARVEQINTQIRLIMRRGYGFHSPDAVISLAMLSLGGLRPPRPHQAKQLA
jgi:transposase